VARLRFIAIGFTAMCHLFAGGELTRLKSSLTKLRQNHPTAAEEIRPGSSTVELIKKMDPQQPWEVHLVMAEWFFRAHMLQSRLSDQAVHPQQDFLNDSWTRIFIASEAAMNGRSFLTSVAPGAIAVPGRNAVLDTSKSREDTPKEMQETITWLCAEVSVRLGDPSKMKQGLRIFELKPNKDSRTQTFAMMAALHTGKWELASQLGKGLLANPKILAALHEQSLNNSDVFDYAALLDWIDKTAPSPFSGALEVRKIPINKFSYRCTKVEGNNPMGVDAAKEVAPSVWTTIPNNGALLSINGALAHCAKPFGHPTPLSGALTPDRLSLRGYVDQAGSRNVDSLELKADPTKRNIWVGTLTSQSSAGSGLTFHYDVEAELDISGLLH